MPTLVANRQRYQAEGSAAVLNFTRRVYVSSGSFSLVGGGTNYPRGYYFAPSAEGYSFYASDASPRASLRFSVGAGDVLTAASAVAFARGYILYSDPAALVSAGTSASLLLQARLLPPVTTYLVDIPEGALQRALRFPSAAGAFSCSTLSSGFQFQPPAPAAGQRREKPSNPYGGSDSTGGSFIRPQYVKYNSALKAKDFGLVSNLLSVAEGELGGQSGSNTAFFVVETDGPAQLRIKNDTASPYTKHYLSVGVLDAARKAIPLTPEGFAYRNENLATPINEATESLSAGVYYFTITCNQWQAIPFSVTMQVIRFKPLVGGAGGSFAPYGRFANAKLYSAATLTAPMSAVIPSDAKIDRLSGAISVTATPVLSLAILRGAATGAMVPYGRLKQTHRIQGAITGIGSNVATLDSAPPYGGGYGPGY